MARRSNVPDSGRLRLNFGAVTSSSYMLVTAPTAENKEHSYAPFYAQAANLWEFSAYGKSGHNYFSILFACANSGA